MLSAAEIASQYATVASALDLSLPLSRKSSTKTSDDYGHDNTPFVSMGNISCNVSKASASQLQLYAGLIGSQRALVLRAMDDTDIREGDLVTYDGLQWLVNGVMNAGSYSVANNYLITVIA